ncbi:MAG: methylcrotonoyl-CoA carboxylase [Corynebacterium variabile]|uniref:Acetyl-CoA carboxylase, carboxyltransferase component (Subunits alpha and beta) n=1 Tax=Corynebacterium variabile TaxID=1727 RepID=A0A0X2NK34_9CORY|nr:carboxyl transferase domain-containing protein [Corynebacterium variabile]MDN6536093.1 methylcrotonoyl-CoA carboxylase [Corynebacterium variabile]MDN6813828.1 methylcrotonoyl-CoA carboxylase [Corynebacterium variabile]MDN6844723.1 methylcrotonoyl-CoA carboxylase [Corynebacterium variabile]CUU65857.1 Acetyl-CoA carboxylase, carboxyltransferase component (subunits alpha and beta) [Corynebacterium variabile]
MTRKDATVTTVTASTDTAPTTGFADLTAELRDRIERARRGGGDKARERHLSRGKMLPRDRVNSLLDPGSPFLEVAPLAAEDMYDGRVPGAGIVAGIGLVEGRLCLIAANDATVSGGTYYPETVKKHLRAQEIAEANRLPCIYLVDSGGAMLLQQDEVFPDRDHFGRIFYNQARMSARGIPQLSAVMGSCTAGGAYVPAISDETVIVDGQGTIFLAGPPLVKAATGEDVTAEELGGGAMHSRVSGVTDHLAADDADAIQRIRDIVATLPEDAPAAPVEPYTSRDQTDLYDIVPTDLKTPYDAREVIEVITDSGSVHEFKAEYDNSVVTAFARIEGHRVGVIANNGVIFAEGAVKAAHFIQLCEHRGTPLLFLQNTTGFMVGKSYEEGGIAKHGAKMVTAVATATVPKLTVITGGGFGAGNYAMCGRAYSPRFLWTWPNSKVSVMGGPQAAMTLSTVRGAKVTREGGEWTDTDREDFERPIRDLFEEKSSCWYGTARLWDDGVIDPADTRRVLAMALGVCARVPRDTTTDTTAAGFGVFRM